jgi:hypothetical protein
MEIVAAGSAPGTLANRGVPTADAGRVDRDEHLVGPGLREGQPVELEIDGGPNRSMAAAIIVSGIS